MENKIHMKPKSRSVGVYGRTRIRITHPLILVYGLTPHRLSRYFEQGALLCIRLARFRVKTWAAHRQEGTARVLSGHTIHVDTRSC